MISRHPLHHVSAADQFFHWITPYGLDNLHCISQFLPPQITAREHVVLIWAVSPKTLGNYDAGLLRFTQFCDQFNIPEDLRMPAPEWILSHFITT